MVIFIVSLVKKRKERRGEENKGREERPTRNAWVL